MAFYKNVFLRFLSFPTHCCISSFFSFVFLFPHIVVCICKCENNQAENPHRLSGFRFPDRNPRRHSPLSFLSFYPFIFYLFYLFIELQIPSTEIGLYQTKPPSIRVKIGQRGVKRMTKNKLMRRWQHQKALVSEGTRYDESCQKRKSIKTETFGPTS